MTDHVEFVYDDYNSFIYRDVGYYLDKGGVFSKEIKNFIVRDGQLKMSHLWQDTIKNSGICICEAGTGTGKTFAYLIPAILSRKTLVISTASKALQDQLVTKDLPLIFDLLKMTPDYMSLKGFSNYLCLKKYHEIENDFLNKNGLHLDELEPISDEDLLDDPMNAQFDFNKETMAELVKIIELSNYQLEHNIPNPDFAEVNSKFPRNITDKITCNSDQCIKSKCPYADECFAFKAREKALDSKVIVINHSFFFSDMQIDDVFSPLSPSILLPKYRTIIFDEAHELPSIGREHLSSSIMSSDLKKLKEDLRYIKKDKNIPYKPFEERYLGLFEIYNDIFAYLKRCEGGGENKRNFLFYKYQDYSEDDKDPFKTYQVLNKDFLTLMRKLYKAYKNYLVFINDNADLDPEFFDKLGAYLKFKIETLVDLMNLDIKDPTKNSIYGKYVGTVEVYRKSFRLALSPLEISDEFGSYLSKCIDNKLSVLLTSATLCVKHNFKKFLKDIGIFENDCRTLEVESNFNYKNQSVIYYSDKFPDAKSQSRIYQIVAMLKDVIENTKGGIFFLTTSNSAMNDAHIALSDLMKKSNNKRKIYRQGHKLANNVMIQKFKEDGNAILIGTSSFWAGVDVQGSALSLVIIDKLPFESPSDPIFKARCNMHDATIKSPPSFISLNLPEAVIKLRQGVGRLIRHEKDRGGLIICDPRVESPKYYGSFINSLPPMTYLDSLDKLKEFLSSNED